MNHVAIHRRALLQRGALGLGSVALACLHQGRATAAPHYPARARRVIFLYMSGGPSHLETFDHKPALQRLAGQPMPQSVTRGQPIAQLQGQKLVVLPPQFRFKRYGQSGQSISEMLPGIGSIADEIAIIRSMHTDQINHDPAHTVMNTGTSISGRPSMGAWVTYGLGSECDNLPGFVVMTSEGGRSPQPISTRMWGPGFLPGRFQGVLFRSKGEPVLYANNPPGITPERQQDIVDAVRRLSDYQQAVNPDPEVETRIAQYELAFRMQTSVPALMDFRDEPRHVLREYGVERMDGTFAANCLLARRLAERGVRFIQLYHRDWDHHNDLVRFMKICCGLCDGPSATLVRDLKRRGMLDDTLIIWGGEFGRTPMAQSNKGNVGRDHHMKGFSMWLAGGGIRGGMSYGGTDELGYHATDNPVHVRDLHATMLHLLGIDHERLSVKHQGLDSRLTGVEPARVVREILV